MRTLLLATTNPGKLRDFKAVLSKLDVAMKSFQGEVEETGSTFEENAVLKAKSCATAAGLPCVADDGGLEINALNGEPGVISRRWPGHRASDEELIAYALERLRDIPSADRSARFRTVVAFATPDGRVVAEERSFEGVIAETASSKRLEGYPYRSIFLLPSQQKYAVDISPEEEERFSHRRQALEALLPRIRKYFEEVE